MMLEDIIAACYAIVPAPSTIDVAKWGPKAKQVSTPRSDDEDGEDLDGCPDSEDDDYGQLRPLRFPVRTGQPRSDACLAIMMDPLRG